MRVIIITTLIFFACGSVRAISKEEQKHHMDNVKSLASAVSIVTKTLELFKEIEATTGEVPTARQKSASTLRFLFRSCIQDIIWTQFFIGAYIEGAPRASCAALQFMSGSLRDKTDRLKGQRSNSLLSLEEELVYQADLGFIMLEATLPYIEEYIPDSCPQHINEYESN